MLDKQGDTRWKRIYKKPPFISRFHMGFTTISSNNEYPAQLEIIAEAGSILQSQELPVSGRLTTAQVFTRNEAELEAIGFCLDVTSPCAKPVTTRGPFNALVIPDHHGNYRVYSRYTKGHLNLTQYPGGGIVVASSASNDSTDVVRRDTTQNVLWQLTLPGRLSAGPYVGPNGEVYIATCGDWACSSSFVLFSITGREPKESSDSSSM
jgi:hypothetical protein